MDNQIPKENNEKDYNINWLDDWLVHLDEMLIKMKKSEIISEIDEK